MPDQLSLQLTGDAPGLPTTLRPMLARVAAGPFDSPVHLFEPSWGGRRLLAFVEVAGGAPGAGPLLRLVDGRGRDIGDRLPELQSLVELVVERPAVLDGELVVPDPGGRADTAALSRRLRGPAGPGTETTPAPPAVYLVFDLLYAGGRPLLGLPLERRRDLLARIVRPSPEVVLVPAVAGAGRDLHAAVVAQGLPGVLARHVRSPYLAGRRSGLWRRVDAAAREPEPEPARAEAPARPVLALLQRLPLDWG